ncbi:MAG: hypothetical protein JWQ01_2960 [Massilia sp.]|nr:hypothetical protein [Massilia sp.]
MSKEPSVEIRIGESSASFASRNAPFLKVDQQPAGLNFYEIRFPAASRGQVTIQNGTHNLAIAHVFSITGTEDLDFKEEGLNEFHIYSALTDADLIAHDEARLKFFAILQNIVQSGWRSIIPLSMARLRGKEMTQYLLATNRRTTLNPSYEPTLGEWMQMKNVTSWKFYSEHMYMSVSFTREHTLTDPTKPGAYLVSFEIKNEAEQFRRHVNGSDRKRWKEVLPPALRDLAASRTKMENEFRLKGFSIDDGYIDPPLPQGVLR